MTSGIAYTQDEKDALKKQIIEILENSVGGTFTGTCNKLSLGRTQAYEWRQEDPDFDRDVNAARSQGKETGLDMAETKLMEAVNNGSTTELIFFLKTQGKRRGYVERTEQDLGVRDGVKGKFTIDIGESPSDSPAE